MARNLITRTVTTTSITALVADKAAALPEACVPLEIVNVETSAKTYGMTIAEFVQHGKEV